MFAILTSIALAAMPVCPPGPRDNCVVDGDTFWTNGEKVRIADIDAPEIRGQCSWESDAALRSQRRLALLLSGRFELRRVGKDPYGRTLAVVLVDGHSVGDTLVAEGLARTWTGRRESWC